MEKYKLDWNNALKRKPTSFGMPVEKSGLDNATLKTGTETEGGDNMLDGAKGLLGVDRTDNTTQQMRNYDDIIGYFDEQMKATEPETAEERRKRLRTERNQSIINGIADVGRAFANLMATNHYAPNGYDHGSQSLTEKQQERMEKAKADREKRRAEYMNYRTMKQKYADAAQDYRDKRLDADRAHQIAKYNADTAKRKLDLYERQEERHLAELELKQQAQEWKEQFEQGKLDIAKLNASIKQMAERNKMSRANINHNLSSWKRTKNYLYDNMGNKIGETEERIVINPQTGDLEMQENTVYDNPSKNNNNNNGGNTPPSRRKNNNNNNTNTPPSRR